MKTLLFCEGKHDSLLLNHMFRLLKYRDTDYKIFDQNERDKLKDLHRAEDDKLRSFIQKSSPYKILVKSEAGIYKVIELFSKRLSFCINNKSLTKTVLLLDLDRRTLAQIIRKLENTFRDHKSGDPLIVEKGEEIKKDPLYLVPIIIKFKRDNQELGVFTLIVFKKSLEYELDKIKLESDEIEDKIKEFVKIKNVKEVFSSVLN